MRAMSEMARGLVILLVGAMCCVMAPPAARGQSPDCCFGGSVWDDSGLNRGIPAIYRPSNGLWVAKGYTRFYFGGGPLDIPVFWHPTSAELDQCRPGIYRDVRWHMKGWDIIYFGVIADIPTCGDYTADGNPFDDIAIFDNGSWRVRNKTQFYYGAYENWPVHGNWDPKGGLTIPAVFIPWDGKWAVRNQTTFYFGTWGDIPVPGRYKGYGGWQAAIFRPSTGMWAIRGVTLFYFGQSGDWPIAANLGNSLGNDEYQDDPVIFRPSQGLWRIRGVFFGGGNRMDFGVDGDIPVAGPRRSD